MGKRRKRFKVEFDKKYQMNPSIILEYVKSKDSDRIRMIEYIIKDQQLHIFDIRETTEKYIKEFTDELFGILIKF